VGYAVAQSLVRELLVNCVVGPILNLFKPPFLNRVSTQGHAPTSPLYRRLCCGCCR